jgi:hypothetical protein
MTVLWECKKREDRKEKRDVKVYQYLCVSGVSAVSIVYVNPTLYKIFQESMYLYEL